MTGLTVRAGALGPGGVRPAVIDPGVGQLSYPELDTLADQIADRLRALGMTPGARIGICTGRSGDAVAIMLGVLRAGGAYVPVAPKSSMSRNAGIHIDSGVSATFVEECYESAYREQVGDALDILTIGSVGGGKGIRSWLDSDVSEGIKIRPSTPQGPEDLAYMIYTSGSTGAPKGVTITRSNLESLMEYSIRRFDTQPGDVFATVAQFSFDMSVFDIHTALCSGSTLVIVPDDITANASAMVDLMVSEKVTRLFAAPVILGLIADLPDLEERDLSSLRGILFGGEVFPTPSLRKLRERLPGKRYFHMYGPTETTVVCTYFEIPADREITGTQPIGPVFDHLEGRVVDANGEDVAFGAEGELIIRGAQVMAGYWNSPDLTAAKTLESTDGGLNWYRTGDVVTEDHEGYYYVARVDRQVKLRGYRIELGEIEAALHEMPGVKEAAVLALRNEENDLYLEAHLGTGSGERISVIKLKKFCSGRLPVYMVPERFVFHTELPRTSADKVDLQKLGQQPLRSS